MLDELGKIVEEYLFNDLPYSMDDYLIEIGRRNLMMLLRDLLPYTNHVEWKMINIGRLMNKRSLPILHPEYMSYYRTDELFVKTAIKSGRKSVIDKVGVIDDHIYTTVVACGGYAFHKYLQGTPDIFINLIGFCMHKMFYTITLHPDYEKIKLNIFLAAVEAKNTILASYILRPTVGDIDKWVLATLPMPGHFEKLVKKKFSSNIIRSLDDAFPAVSIMGMYNVSKLLNFKGVLQMCSSPIHVNHFLLFSITENDVNAVRELVKYDYHKDHLELTIFHDTYPEIIKLVEFEHYEAIPRILLYKQGIVRSGVLLREFSEFDLPALFNPNLVCDKSFLVSLVEHFAIPRFHPLYNRHKYKRELTLVVSRLNQMGFDHHL